MKRYRCTLLHIISAILLLTAAALLLSAMHGLWTGRLFIPGEVLQSLPHSAQDDPMLYWLSMLLRLSLAAMLLALGLIVRKAVRKQCDAYTAEAWRSMH